MLSNMSQVGGCAPPANAAVTLAKAPTGQSAHNGWRPSGVSAIAAPPAAALMSRVKRSSGSNGTSHGLTAIALAPRLCAQVSPALTPARGPAASPGASCNTGKPSARAKAAASVSGRVFTATAEQLLCKRLTAHISKGRPARTATAFSPPKRTERPPAITTPTTEPEMEFGSECELMIARAGRSASRPHPGEQSNGHGNPKNTYGEMYGNI